MTKLRDLKLDDEVLDNDSPILAETFETVNKNLNSYPYALSYTDDVLTSITYDLGDGQSIIKTFNYTDEVITSIVLSGDLPDGISVTKTFAYTDGQLTSITYS